MSTKKAYRSSNPEKVHLTISLIVFAIAIFGLVASSVEAQGPDKGFRSANTFAASGLDAINLSNGNLVMNIPIASLPAGRGASPGYTVSLQYNSKLWDSNTTTRDDGYPDEQGNTHYRYSTISLSDSGGWRFFTAYNIRITDRRNFQTPNVCWLGDPVEELNFRWKLEMEMPDGSIKQFYPTDQNGNVIGVYTDGFANIDSNGASYSAQKLNHNGVCYTDEDWNPNYITTGMNYITMDGSNLRLFIPRNSNNWKLFFPNGTVVENAPPDNSSVYQRLTDRNGNRIEHTAAGIVDELGRAIKFGSDTVGQWVSVKGVGGETVKTHILFGTRWVNQEYVSSNDINAQTVYKTANVFTSMQVVEKIIFPEQLGVQEMTFEYWADEEQPGFEDETNGWGEIKSVELPTGASAEYAYYQDNTFGGETPENVLNRHVEEKELGYDDEYDGQSTPTSDSWLYSVFKWESSVTLPNGSGSIEKFIYNQSFPSLWDTGLTYQSNSPGLRIDRLWAYNVAGSLPSVWTTAGGVTSNIGSANAFVKTEFQTVPDSSGNPDNWLTAIKDLKHDKNGNVLEILEYDWVTYGSIPKTNGRVTGLPSSGLALKRKTVNTYYNQAADAGTTANGNEYSNPTAPKLLNLIKSTEIRDGSGNVRSRSEFYYDDEDTTGNLVETRVWDSTKGAVSSPLTSGNSLSTFAEYDQYGNVVETTDGNGNVTTIIYGNVTCPDGVVTGLYPTQTIVADGTAVERTSSAVYDCYTGLVTTATDEDNDVSVVTEYDDLGRPVKVRTAAGTGLESWVQTEYHDEDRYVVVKADLETVGDGKKVAIQHFDQLGRVRLSRTLEDASTQSASNETDGIKVQTRYATTYSSPNGYTYSLTSNPYRAATSSAASSEPTMGWTRSKAWSHGRRSEVETFTGSALPAPWGSNTSSTGVSVEETDANTETTTDEAGKKRRTIEDALGRLVRVDEPDGSGNLGTVSSPNQATSYSYDTLGNLTQIVQGGQTRTFTYSSLSRLLSAANPESGTFTYTYDPNGNLLTKTDARSISTTYTYDALNRVTFRDYSDSTPDITYSYDDSQIPFSKGKLTKVASSVSETSYLAFDAQERITASRQRTDGLDYDFQYTYTLGGNLKTQTYPSGKVVSFAYDQSGDLSAVSGVTGATHRMYANAFGYAPHGVVEKVRLGNGRWETTQFNGNRQITQVGLGSSATNHGLWKINYEYGELQGNGTVDAAKDNGNLARQTISVPTIGDVSGFTAIQSYTYDSLDRLKSAAETVSSSQTWKQTFSYDRFGNRNFDTGNTTIQSVDSTTAKVVNPEILASNNRFKEDQDSDSIADYLYDSSGNITKSAQAHQFTYDAENRQITATGTGLSTSYSYDPNGKRVKSHNAINGQTTVFVYDAGGRLSAEYTIDVPAPSNPTISYLTEDALGSVRVTTDTYGELKARRDFLPFGEELYAGLAGRNSNQKYSASADDTRKKFATYQRDAETGLDYAQSRYYSPMHGRFTSPDEFKGGPDELFDFEEDASDNPTFYADLGNPQSLNKYQYSYNNPYKYNDPTGHCPICPAFVKAKERMNTALDIAQTAISVVGLIPAAGEIADGANAAISVARGNYGEAALDLAGMAGPVSAVAIANRVRKITKTLSKADNVVDTATSTAKTVTTVTKNAEKGKDFEKKVTKGLQKGNQNVQKQVTIKTKSGLRTRVDNVATRRSKIRVFEAKSSQKARLSKNQKEAFAEIEKSGGTVVGKGKPGYRGGTEIPPQKVKIIRGNEQ